MTIIQNFVPLLGTWLSGFGSWLPALFALGVIFSIPRILKEIVSYV